MTEIELSVLARASQRGHNAEEKSLNRTVVACLSQLNTAAATINWRFTTQDARAKMHLLNPDSSTLIQYQFYSRRLVKGRIAVVEC